jgi:hypothetical protein
MNTVRRMQKRIVVTEMSAVNNEFPAMTGLEVQGLHYWYRTESDPPVDADYKISCRIPELANYTNVSVSVSFRLEDSTTIQTVTGVMNVGNRRVVIDLAS